MTLQSDVPYEEGDTISIATWGRLSNGELAQHGVDVLVGLIRAYHVDCPLPNHFWCATPENMVLAMADLYQANDEEGGHYIGCYLHGADFDSDGIPTIHEAPSLKALMQLLDDGRVLVKFGRLTNEGSERSAGGLGLLDEQTAEFIVVTPVPVPNVPPEPGDRVTFVLQRSEDFWHIAHYPHDDESPESAQVQVFVSFPVDPNPTPLTVLKINEPQAE